MVLPAGPATQLKVPIDILIGSIPIRFNQQQQVEQLPLSPPPYQDPSPTQPASTSTSGANLLLTQLGKLFVIILYFVLEKTSLTVSLFDFIITEYYFAKQFYGELVFNQNH